MAPFVLRAADDIRWVAQETSWQDIPGVQVVGAVLGILLLLAALRAMFGKRR
ncbi:hypothetical protein O7632_21185 [Solwaraspora sp. WMMD406]|uniref:hypothetical protein n=1 Tax=Solwaraspora sp. WMMD406 TaxID=3016095 RepID=UPI002415F9FD|nr:hypothetical protein [Solwaraspora sp. WMMD406]MDG4766590.1 hypothetical protein [Solwaraspora sp. WMMD406]